MTFSQTPAGDFVVELDATGAAAVMAFSRNQCFALLSALEKHLHAQPQPEEMDE